MTPKKKKAPIARVMWAAPVDYRSLANCHSLHAGIKRYQDYDTPVAVIDLNRYEEMVERMASTLLKQWSPVLAKFKDPRLTKKTMENYFYYQAMDALAAIGITPVKEAK